MPQGVVHTTTLNTGPGKQALLLKAGGKAIAYYAGTSTT